MGVKIRQENSADFKAVFELIEIAFQSEQYSDQTEQFLVERLRKSSAFIPELSIVAETNKRIVGHILVTKLHIKGNEQEYDSLALAPVSVLPDYQRKGIGGMLIKQAHQVARRLGYKSIVLIGHEEYYPRFGYQKADRFGIQFPFDAPAENCMVIELVKDGLKGISGIVEYPGAFFE